ncbi:HPr family phosphocarrier protein [Nigerium massiliense]|uniref:HPr family phosphocarrier protein n=1 Tax=Nigerium massiliense TaxID=1522317 RepID=UPI0021C3FD5D|nr:HPr family phosphocarrier protein [Nigerium massiliense]
MSEEPDGEASEEGELTWSATLSNPHGLHARPAAVLVQALSDADADVQLTDVTNGNGPVPAANMLMLTTLDARNGDELRATITGPDAAQARDALQAWADGGFGEAPQG